MHFICMASGREEEGLRGATAQMNFPLLLNSWGMCRCTHTHTQISTLLIFPHPLSSFNIGFTASCFSQIPLSSKSAAAFEDKCDQNGGGRWFKKKSDRRAFGFQQRMEQSREADKCSVWGQLWCLMGCGCCSHIALRMEPHHIDRARPPRPHLYTPLSSCSLEDKVRGEAQNPSIKSKSDASLTEAVREVWFIRNNMIPLAYHGYSSKQQKHDSLFFFFKCYRFVIIDIKQ